MFYTYREICRHYDCDITLMQYNSIMSAIPLKKKIKDDGQYIWITNIDIILDIVMYSDGTCKKISKLIIKVRGPFVQTLCIEKDSYMDAI